MRARRGRIHPLRAFRAWSLALVLGLVVVGCTAASDGGPESADVRLDCRDHGFPCTWDGVPEAAFTASMALLADAGAALDAGDDPAAVAAELEDAADVVAVVHDETGVQFRVDGAPVVVAHAPLASPLFNAVEALARTGDLPLTTAARAADGHPGVSDTVVAATYGTTRAPDVRPRSALLIRPWESFDLDTLHRVMQAKGLVDRDAEPDWDELVQQIDGTAQVFRDSEHFTVTRDDSVEAFASFGSHDVVIVETHSSTFGASRGCDPAAGHVCGPVLGGPVLAPASEDDDPYVALQFAQLERLPVGATVGRIFDQWTVAFTADYFRHQYRDQRPLDTILFLNACKTGGEDIPVTGLTSAVAGTDTGGEGGAVFAWTNAIDAIHADTTTSVIAQLLADDALPTATAMDILERDPALREHLVGGVEAARLIRLGDDVRARDAIRVEDRGETMEPGAVIQVVGEPEDGVDDVIGALTLRVEGVLVDELDDAVLRWQLPVRHGERIEVAVPFSGAGATVQDVSDDDDDTGRWQDLLVTFTNLDLEFDLERDDLICCREHTLVVELEDGDGELTRHEIAPVFLRQEVVEVLDPAFGQPLAHGDRVEIDGIARDGVDEVYPLVVSIDHVDRQQLDAMSLTVVVADQVLGFPPSTWEEVDEGRYRVQRMVPLHDFSDDEEVILVDAHLNLPERGSVTHEVDPLILELEQRELSACDLFTSADVTSAFGRPFGEPTSVLENTCRWDAARSNLAVTVWTPTSGDMLASLHDELVEQQVQGVGDRAYYDVAKAQPPSGIRGDDGEMTYNNFVTLQVEVDSRWFTMLVGGNIVIEDGVDAVLSGLGRLVELVAERF